jgi:mycothiol S-conjugate amidase
MADAIETLIFQPEYQPATRPTMLILLAHPDDESFGMGGTIARYSEAGAAVYLVCATDGEEGSVDARLLADGRTTAQLRRAELLQAADALGLSGLILLHYRDSGMAGSPANAHPQALAAQPVEAVAAQLTAILRRLRPQVVVTFDPIGGYRHPDHIAIHEATRLAYRWSADAAMLPEAGAVHQPQRLYYTTFSRRWLRLMVRILPLFGRDPRRFGRNQDIDIAELASVEFPLHASVDTISVWRRARDASAAHLSQGGAQGWWSYVTAIFGAVVFGRDSFMQADPPAEAGRQRHDLFDGVRW